MRFLLIAALALATLAGCGTSPAHLAAPKAGALAAKKNTSTKAAIIQVPASTFVYLEDHLEKLRKQHEDANTKVHFGVKLVASRDGFKREKLEAKLPAESLAKLGSDRAFGLGMLNGGIEPGEYSYYLVMSAWVVRTTNNRPYLDVLDDFYVSDYGRNYKATLK